MPSNGSLNGRQTRLGTGPILRKTADCHEIIMGPSPHVSSYLLFSELLKILECMGSSLILPLLPESLNAFERLFITLISLL
jgi:hypothetical protein